jgi:hypothetical protein
MLNNTYFNRATQPMAHRASNRRHRDQAALSLISTVREIVDTIGWRRCGGRRHCGPAGRPADGYYHLRRLVDAGVLREGEDRGDGRGRRCTVAQRGKRVHLKYGAARARIPAPSSRSSRHAAHGRARFRQALRSGAASGAGELRDLWASRLKGWVNDADLRDQPDARAPRRTAATAARSAPQPPRHAGLMLAPIDGKPLRRRAAPRRAKHARHRLIAQARRTGTLRPGVA